MNTTSPNSVRRLFGAAFVVLALALAGCGGSSSSSTTSTTPPASSTTAPTSTSSGGSGGIPQGNAGDHDVDNNGGPSDGDGQV